MEPPTWREALDEVQRAVQALDAADVEAMTVAEAQAAAKTAERAGRQLFFWRRGVEATYFGKYAHVPGVVAAVALQEEVPQVQALAELLAAGGLQPVWYKLEQWAVEHGVTLWPEPTKGGTDADSG